MVKSPCLEKMELKKGPWTPEEDQKLLAYIEEHGHGSWRALPAKAGLQRCGKSCRLRWTNYLRPDIKRGKFSFQEEQTIIQLHALLGNRWSAIAAHLPRRTDNEIKNYWNTHVKKRLDKMGIDPMTHKPKANAFGLSSSHSRDAANLSHMAQWESARLEAEARLARESKQLVSDPHLQNLLSSSASAQLTNKAAATPVRPPCLDVLKAWHGVVAGMFSIAGCCPESPSFALNLSDNGENTLAVPAVGVHENLASSLVFATNINNNSVTCKGGMAQEGTSENDWKCFEKYYEMPQVEEKLDSSMALHEISVYSDNNAWLVDSFRAAEEGAPVANRLEAYSDILISDSNDQNMHVAGENSNGTCAGNLDDNANYWNSILNVMNAWPFGSPVF